MTFTKEEDDKNSSSPCGLCCFTLVAISVVSISALTTLLVANSMYTGLPERKHINFKQFESPESRLLIESKQIALLKDEPNQRCLLLPLQIIGRSQGEFSLDTDPLTHAEVRQAVGEKAWPFCAPLPVFLVSL
ncbi:hypothetical protein WR25_09668 [Diploscapter pachys]|uniref:Uncharacterized protein n=1 Tax=Diploscapter pachys TaxID=2018661 RepID=A0A2A2K867_9BILA|nr:hypothetical protein WR25_09668 [Diploscapter pachys]